MRSLFLVLCSGGLVAVCCMGPIVAFDQKALPTDRLTNGARVLVAFEPVVQAVRPSVVRVLMDGKPVALGLIVSTDGLVITKASEIDPVHQIAIQRGKEKFPARSVGWSESHDLVCLKANVTGWPVPVWSEGADPSLGQFLITPGVETLPITIGVVSVARRAIEKDQIHGVLGVQLEDTSAEAVIMDLFEGSAALAAGLQIGDSIVKVGTVTIASRVELVDEIRLHAPGETVTLEIRRDGKALILPATLTHPFGGFLSQIAQQNRLGGEISHRASGFPAAIQHDSVLKPEECGGPALNMDGQIVGINIARSGRTESLLIPTSVIREVLQSQVEGQLPKLVSISPSVPPPPPAVTPVVPN